MAPTGTSPGLFDRWSITYDRPDLQRSTYRPIHDAVLRRLAGTAPSAILDLGCGTGQLTRRLATRFPDAGVIGLDASAGMLAGAATADDPSDPIAALVRADALHLPFAPGSFDVVTCTESFHWYPDQAQALDEIRRVLTPRGRLLLVSVAMVTRLGDDLLRRATRAAGQPVAALPPRRLRALLTRAGFRVTGQRRLPRLQPPWPVLTDASRAA
jgi:ubiquinone/menaquinone biosynthesis C-methylase UbiE